MIWLWLLAPIAAIATILAIPSLRRRLFSDRVLAAFRKVMPPMSRDRARCARGRHGLVGRRAVLRPARLAKLLAFPQARRSRRRSSASSTARPKSSAAIATTGTPTSINDLPPQAWQYIKDKGFLGMIIPKSYGGLGFSAYAHSQVVAKLSTRCSAAAVTVMVPNSLGPAELLLHYGTEEQKRHYLPRLAKGLEIPCFALTNPHAGSDAAAIPDCGVVCRGEWEGARGARHARHLGQALHHARPGRDAARPRVPALRSRPPARRRRGPRHHLRAHPDAHAGRAHRPAPHAAERGVPERPELGQATCSCRSTGSSAASRCRARAGGC